MVRLRRKKPKADEFATLVEQCGGNLTMVAKALDVTRKTVYEWCQNDSKFRDAVEESRSRLFDKCFASAQAIALGIPDYKYEEDDEGKVTKKMVGWLERPDANMLKYLMGTLGKHEGFGDSIDVTSNGETIKPMKIVVVNNNEEYARLKAEDEERKKKRGEE